MKNIFYDVPPHSQYLDVKNKRWRLNACGIVALFQILEYFLGRGSAGSLSGIIQLGVKKEAYVAKRGGWVHKGLSDIAENFGIKVQTYDFTDMPDRRALRELLKLLKKGPVLVSVHKDFDKRNGGHIIVLTGISYKNKGVFISYNEPASRAGEEMKRFVSEDIFLSGWKKRVISFSKPSMEQALFDTYISVIQSSVGSKMFQHLYMTVDGKKRDILRGGELSCAFFVSSILLMFALIGERHATVAGTVAAIEKYGWKKIKRPKVGAILVWEEKKEHKHIGFYIGDNKAISNSPTKKVPASHHFTFGTLEGVPKRKIEAIYWHKNLQ